MFAKSLRTILISLGYTHLYLEAGAAAIAPTTGIIAWVPQFNQVGQHPIIVEVRDAAGLTDLQSFTIQVANVNDPPTQPTLIVSFTARCSGPNSSFTVESFNRLDNDSVSYYAVTGELLIKD